MLKFTDEVLARAFLLGCLGLGPTSRSDVLREAESHALTDLIPVAKAGFETLANTSITARWYGHFRLM